MTSSPGERPAAGVPWVHYDVATGALSWAAEVYTWHGLDPGAATPTWELMAACRHPDDAAEVADAIADCLFHGTGISSLHRLADPGCEGAWRWVVLSATAELTPSGAVAGLRGHLVDVTVRQNRALAEWATAAVDRALDSRSVIDQAKGALMLTYGLDAAAAFRLLVWQSRHANVKLRELAERLLDAARGNPDSACAVRARLDEIFYVAAFRPGRVPVAPGPRVSTLVRRAPVPAFEVRESVRDGTQVVTVRGEVDLATAPDLDAALARALGAAIPPHPIVVDLAGVRHLGSIGVGLLAAYHRRAQRRGTPLRVVAAPGPVRAVLSLLAADLSVVGPA